MKHLKLFDSHTMGKYWHINLPKNFNDFGAYLYKIGVDETSNSEIFKKIEFQVSFNIYPPTEIYIGYRLNNWKFYYNQKFEDYYYIYQGEVSITDKDIEKWEINQQAKKYNL